MRIEVLAEFRDLAHSLNYASTAKQLNVSQPNLSKHMSELEKELGFELFTRSRKNNLTPAGRVYLDAVCRMLLAHERAVAECKEIRKNNAQELRVLSPVIRSEAIGCLYKALESYKERNPFNAVSFRIGRDESGFESIAEGRADLAIVSVMDNFNTVEMDARKSGLSLLKLVTAPLYVWIHTSNPLSELPAISWHDLRGPGGKLAFAANRSFDDFRFASTDLLVKMNIFPKCALSVYAARNADEFYMSVKPDEVCLVTKMMSEDPTLSFHANRIIRPIIDTKAEITFYLVLRPDMENVFHPLLEGCEETALCPDAQ